MRTYGLSFIEALWQSENQLEVGDGQLLLISDLHSDAVVLSSEGRGLVAKSYTNTGGARLDTFGGGGGGVRDGEREREREREIT